MIDVRLLYFFGAYTRARYITRKAPVLRNPICQSSGLYLIMQMPRVLQVGIEIFMIGVRLLYFFGTYTRARCALHIFGIFYRPQILYSSVFRTQSWFLGLRVVEDSFKIIKMTLKPLLLKLWPFKIFWDIFNVPLWNGKIWRFFGIFLRTQGFYGSNLVGK